MGRGLCKDGKCCKYMDGSFQSLMPFSSYYIILPLMRAYSAARFIYLESIPDTPRGVESELGISEIDLVSLSADTTVLCVQRTVQLHQKISGVQGQEEVQRKNSVSHVQQCSSKNFFVLSKPS
jgi:hypothetical protein